MARRTFSRFVSTFAAAAAFTFGAAAFADTSDVKLNVGGAEGAGGSIKGVAKFNGEQKKRKEISMEADKYCNEQSAKAPKLDEKFVFGDNGTLQNVFVYVSKGVDASKGPFKPLIAKPEIDQIGCTYVPHVMGVVTGQELTILNGDATLHNVKFSGSNNPASNDGMPQKGMKLTKKYNKVEMPASGKANFACDVHPWMSAYVFVLDHPFFAVTQKDGSFEIKGLPAGEYEVTFWHEFSPFKPDNATVKVKVEDGKAAEANVTFAPPAK